MKDTINEKDLPSKVAEGYDPGPWEGPGDTTVLIKEVVSLMDHAQDLLNAHLADLAGPEAYREFWTKRKASKTNQGRQSLAAL